MKDFSCPCFCNFLLGILLEPFSIIHCKHWLLDIQFQPFILLASLNPLRRRRINFTLYINIERRNFVIEPMSFKNEQALIHRKALVYTVIISVNLIFECKIKSNVDDNDDLFLIRPRFRCQTFNKKVRRPTVLMEIYIFIFFYYKISANYRL